MLKGTDGIFTDFKDTLRRMKPVRSTFPVVFIHWREKYNRFDGNEFKYIPILEGMFEYEDFRQVQKAPF